jgi:hypothetical protein
VILLLLMADFVAKVTCERDPDRVGNIFRFTAGWNAAFTLRY